MELKKENHLKMEMSDRYVLQMNNFSDKFYSHTVLI